MGTLDEFGLIQKYFSAIGDSNASLLGVGDDAAVMPIASSQLIAATDTLIEGVHFPAGCDPAYIASRALRVNLSDFAAMGATPRWFTLALNLPHVDEQWLDAFSAQLAREAEYFAVTLVGGDTCRGALSLSLTVMGESTGPLLYRQAAKPGDSVWVSGKLGEAAAALPLVLAQSVLNDVVDHVPEEDRDYLLARYYAPEPRIRLGQRLCGVARAAIDISDGLFADAMHIAKSSQVSMVIDCHAIPLPHATAWASLKQRREWALSGGDDYELLFTVPAERDADIGEIARDVGLQCYRIGAVKESAGQDSAGLHFTNTDNEWDALLSAGTVSKGYRHF